MDTLQDIVAYAATLPAIDYANEWTAVKGRERVYLGVAKSNGGRNWNDGKGYLTCFIEPATKTLFAKGEAGAKTRNHARESFDLLAEKYNLTLKILKQ